MSQVVIVGAGPAGATLALLFVRRGISVRLIEAAPTFRRSFRGEGLMPSGLQALEQMGLPIDHLPHRSLDAWEFSINNRSLFRVEEPILAGEPSCTLVSQPALLEALIEQARAHPQFEFIQGLAVRDLQWADQRVAGVKLADGQTLAADLVIGADGRSSLVRQQANLALEQQSQNFDILWFKLADSPRFEAENVFYSVVCDRHAFGLFRSSESHLQLGWMLHQSDATDWKQVDWKQKLAAASPPWLAEHVLKHDLERPVLLSVTVGRCSYWHCPGLLLIGDAAHPMSPIRAQGINMALRDVIVTANHLVPWLQGDRTGSTEAIDAALAQIQAEREPEVIRIQQLQSDEAAQAELLHRHALLRWGVSQMAPLVRTPIRWAWLKRQRQLRQGVLPIQLTV